MKPNFIFFLCFMLSLMSLPDLSQGEPLGDKNCEDCPVVVSLDKDNTSQQQQINTKQDILRLEEKIEELEETIEKLRKKNGSLLEEGIKVHRNNYVFPVTFSSYTQELEKAEIKFQLSFKQKLIGYFGYSLYFAYSQRSFWTAYDTRTSRPFRETNYNPSAFIRSPVYSYAGWGKIRGDVGFEHESNGLGNPGSKSWDRFYVELYHRTDYLLSSIKAWYRPPDESPELRTYYGDMELNFEIFFEKAIVELMWRWNIQSGYSGGRVDLIYPTFFNRKLMWHVQLWTGYGESLNNYNRNITRFGIGIMFAKESAIGKN